MIAVEFADNVSEKLRAQILELAEFIEVRGDVTLAIGIAGEKAPEPEPQPEPEPEPRFTLGQIGRFVAFETGISEAAICGDCRTVRYVRVRDAVVWAGHHLLARSSVVIGRYLGGRDHSTILAAIKRADDRRERDPAFALLIDRLKTTFAETVQ